jgi:hypothetical protein
MWPECAFEIGRKVHGLIGETASMYIFSTLNFFADSESYSGLIYQCIFKSDQSALRISSSLSLLMSIGGPSPQGKSILMSIPLDIYASLLL